VAPGTARDSRVEPGGDVERAAIRPRDEGLADRIAVAKVANYVVRAPLGTPGRRGPIIGAEPSEDRGEPPPLLGEHLQQVPWAEVARARGPQQQLAWPDPF